MLVAGVSAATPAGLLVEVTAIDGSTVQATEASLGDALEQGEFLMEQQFTPADVTSVEFAPGVVESTEAQALPASSGGSAGSPALGQEAPRPGVGLGFNYTIDVEIVTGVRATGSVGFDIGCGAYGGLTWKKVWGVPVYPNGVYFEAKCGASQQGAVTLTGSAGLSVEKHYDLAFVTLTPLTFVIGVVPVVLVPKITVSIDASGKIAASMSVGASEHFSATVGIRYSDGFHVIKEFSSGFDKQLASGSARLSIKGGVSLSQSLLLYGVAGPRLTESLYLDLVGKPPGEKPVWCLRGGLKGTGSIGLDLGVKYLGWGPKELFNWSKELGCASNTKPTITVHSPDEGQSIYPGNGGFILGFSGDAFDEEDGDLPINWSSNKSGVLGTTKPGVTLPIPDLSIGTHTITATAVDGDGAKTTKTFSLVVKDGSPRVAFQSKNSAGDWVTISSLSGTQGSVVYFRLAPSSPVPTLVVTCDNVAFTGLAVTRLGGCNYSMALPKQGTFTLSVKLTDADGKSATAAMSVAVGPPPSTVTPAFSPIAGTGDGYFLANGASITSWVDSVTVAVIYDNAAVAATPVKYLWELSTTRSGSPPGAWTTLGAAEGPTSSGSSRTIDTINSGSSSLLYEIRLTITSGSGAPIETQMFSFEQAGIR